MSAKSKWVVAILLAGALLALLIAFLAAPGDPRRMVVHPVIGEPLALSGLTIVDVRDGSLRPGQTLLMEGGHIISVTDDASFTPEAGLRRVDLAGQFVVPGYNDLHAHPLGVDDPGGSLGLMLAAGITGFRQMHGSKALLEERQASTLPLGPDSPALLEMPGELLTPLNAANVDMALETVRHQKAAGADFIKIGLVRREVLLAVLGEARRLGLPVAGHVPPDVAVIQAAEEGMRAIEHLGPGDGLLVECSSERDALRAELDALPPVKGPPVRLPGFVERLADRWLQKLIVNPALLTSAEDTRRRELLVGSFDESRCREAARALKATGSWQVPTLIRLKTTGQADLPEFAGNPELRYMPPETVELWKASTSEYLEEVPAAARALYREDHVLALRLVKILDEEGVPMMAGSDVSGVWEVPGDSLHREFDELARAGLSPLRILQMATIDGARYLGRTDSAGTVEPGRNADLVILGANPVEDVSHLHQVRGVVRAGRYYDSSAIAALKARIEAGRGHLQ